MEAIKVTCSHFYFLWCRPRCIHFCVVRKLHKCDWCVVKLCISSPDSRCTKSLLICQQRVEIRPVHNFTMRCIWHNDIITCISLRKLTSLIVFFFLCIWPQIWRNSVLSLQCDNEFSSCPSMFLLPYFSYRDMFIENLETHLWVTRCPVYINKHMH